MTDSIDLILRRFHRLVQKDQLAHAYLFIGPRDVGKNEAALAVAQLINCEQGEEAACRQCPSCLKIAAGTHPDVAVVDRGEEQTIKVAKIRELIARVPLRPFEARKKIFILKNAEDLTPEGSNTLLKTLEEPAKDNVLILTTSVPEKILPTIKSRCHVVYFAPLAPRQLEVLLAGGSTSSLAEAHFAAYFAQGCPGRARRLIAEKFLAGKNEIIDNMVFQRNNEAYLKSIVADREMTRCALEVLLSWFRDIMLLKTGVAGADLIHADRGRDLTRSAEGYSFNQLGDIVTEIKNTTHLLDENLNVKIPLSLLREKIWAK